MSFPYSRYIYMSIVSLYVTLVTFKTKFICTVFYLIIRIVRFLNCKCVFATTKFLIVYIIRTHNILMNDI